LNVIIYFEHLACCLRQNVRMRTVQTKISRHFNGLHCSLFSKYWFWNFLIKGWMDFIQIERFSSPFKIFTLVKVSMCFSFYIRTIACLKVIVIQTLYCFLLLLHWFLYFLQHFIRSYIFCWKWYLQRNLIIYLFYYI
jgi:hypothetical protein